MRKLFRRFILSSAYAAFILSFFLYFHESLKYRGIEAWPSVDARIVGGGGGINTFPGGGKFGGSTTIDNRWVEFEYFIEDHRYVSKTARPNGGGLPLEPMHGAWKAFYNPSSPDVAVLSPIPYSGVGLIIVAGCSGSIVLAHLLSALLKILKNKTQWGPRD